MEGDSWPTEELRVLAMQLRQYRAFAPAPVPAVQDTLAPDSGGMETERTPTKNAAVLVPLFYSSQGELRVYLTQRSKGLSSHGGEVALPGGKRDPTDASDDATALREAHEEIGLDPSTVRIVTRLEPFLSKHLLTVTPVVGLLPAGATFTPVPNLGEVDTAFDAPLRMFLKDVSHQYKDTRWLDMPYRLHYFDYQKDAKQFNIWGLTAAILIRTAAVVFQQEPEFHEFHPDAPDFKAVLTELARQNVLSL